MAESYDLLLKNGDIVDPSQDMRRRGDVAFRDGRVAAVAADIPVAEAAEVADRCEGIKRGETLGNAGPHGHPRPFLLPRLARRGGAIEAGRCLQGLSQPSVA